MAAIATAPLTFADAPAMARNNMSAFWEDQNWVLMWPHSTCEFVIAQATRRAPQNLITNAARRRHLKAVDPATGALLGYARWLLPEGGPVVAAAGGHDSLWPAAKPPVPTDTQREEAAKEFAAAKWHAASATDALDPPVQAVKRRLLEGKQYLILEYLAVHPDNKGKGVASALVAAGLKAAHEMGLDTFILAFEAAKGVYLRAGFKILDQVIQDDTKYGGPGVWAVYYMLDEVQKAES